ncbi:MAG: RluA family pseudouridine synthase [Acidimicrobiales bacterium]
MGEPVATAVPAAMAGERLDRVVAMMTGVSRAAAAELVSRGAVEVDGAAVTTRSQRVSEGSQVRIELPAQPTDVGFEPDPDVVVSVVYEDQDLFVVDKPAGLVVHPGAGQAAGTLVHGLVARDPGIRLVGQPDRPGIVHRLDKGTSGLMLVARTTRAYEELVAMLSARAVERRYWALVWGHVEAPSGQVDAPVGRSMHHRTRMAVTMRGRPALTRYDVHQRYRQPAAVTELACTLATGRTHQIRVHMASIGHPVVGDARYGGARSTLQIARPALHAGHLALAHPVTGAPLGFDAPLPDDLARLREQLVL